MTQFNDQLPGGLPVPSVKVPQQSRRGQDSNPGKPEFFQAFFSDDLLCIYTCYSYGVQVTMSGLSLRAGGRGFSPATKRVAPGYFFWKIEEK